MKKLVVVMVALICLSSLAMADRPQKDNPWFRDAPKVIQTQRARRPVTCKANNVILFISDGNGVGYRDGPGAYPNKGITDDFPGRCPDLVSGDSLDPDYAQQALIHLISEIHSGEDVTIYARGPWAHLFDGTVLQNYILHVRLYTDHGE